MEALNGSGAHPRTAWNTRITSCVVHAHVSFYMIKSAAGSTVTPVGAGKITVKVAKLLIARFKRGDKQRVFTVELYFFITALIFQTKLAYSCKHTYPLPQRLCALYILIESKHSFPVVDVH